MMQGKKPCLILLTALLGGLALPGCGHPDPTLTAAPPPGPNAPPPINASQTKRFAGARGLTGGGATAPQNPGPGQPFAKPRGM